MQAVGCLRHQRDSRNVRERVPIVERDLPPATDPIVEDEQLPASDSSEHVAETIVVAHLAVLVTDPRITRLRRPEARLLHFRWVSRHQHPAAGRGDDLVPVERKNAHLTERADRVPAVQRAQRLRGILQDGHAVAAARLQDGIEIGALAVQVNDDHCFRQLPCARARL